MTKSQEIFSIIPQIIAEIGPVEKDRKATMKSDFGSSSYQFRGIDDMYNALNPLFGKYGLFFSSEIVSKDNTILTVKDKQASCVNITMRFTVYAKDGSYITTETIGEARDYADKACSKAMSNCYKYALMQLFCIPTEEPKDIENDNITVQPKKKPTVEEMIDKYISEGMTNQSQTDWIKKNKEKISGGYIDKLIDAGFNW